MFYMMGILPDYKINYIACFVVLLLICISQKALKPHKTIFMLILVQCLTWAIYSVIHLDTAYFTRIFYLMIVYLLLSLVYKRRETINYIELFNGWCLLQALLGTIGVLLVLLNILQPISTFIEMDGNLGYNFGLFTTKTYFGGLVRNGGFFDEPGALAFWGVIALLMNKVFIGNRKIENLLLIGLISTFSMAYFIQVAMYFMLFNRGTKIKTTIVSVGLFSLLLYFFVSFNEDLNEAILGRFLFDSSTGQFEGDNRSDLAEVSFHYFKQAPLFGNGATGMITISERIGEFVGSNPFTLLAVDGIIGYGIALLPFFVVLLKKSRNKYILYSWLIILAGFLQRPYDSTQLLYPLSIYLFLQAELIFDKTNNYPVSYGKVKSTRIKDCSSFCSL